MGLNFGTWEYRYDNIGQLVSTVSPTGAVSEYTYDLAGRQLTEIYNGDLEAEYFYDVYPGDDVLGLEGNFEWPGYPAYAVNIGRTVAIKDKSGVSIMASDHGSFSECPHRSKMDPLWFFWWDPL